MDGGARAGARLGCRRPLEGTTRDAYGAGVHSGRARTAGSRQPDAPERTADEAAADAAPVTWTAQRPSNMGLALLA